jgi:pyrimidine-nucleoside phosphorylase
MVDLIEKKRDGLILSSEEIRWFVQAYTDDKVPDYQMAALMMAIFIRGMSREETVALTLAMANSGDQLDLHDVAPFVIDKHSSGGVGDKTSLVVLPIVAAAGVPVGKMSGRGLGSSGGTLDKMESIPGWSSAVPLAQFKQQLAQIGLVLAGQTAVLAPADGKMYALRDVTGTVGSMPLIAGSIMSKKLAAGADGIVLDVKVGSGAFMTNLDDARELAHLMVDIGKDAGRKIVALLSDMNQPLGHTIGNALELREAVETLQGGGPADFWAHCEEIAAHMLHLAGKGATVDRSKQLVNVVRKSGVAFDKFREMVAAQGGETAVIDDLNKLPKAAHISAIKAPHDGYIATINTGELGWAAVQLGGGRLVKTDTIDHAVGIQLTAKVGDRVQAGEVIGQIHANDPLKQTFALGQVLTALTITDEAQRPLPLFYGTLS